VLKIKLWTVLGVLMFAAALGPLSFFLVASHSEDAVTTDISSDEAAAFATQVARDYLAAQPTDLPVAKEVDPQMGIPSDGTAQPIDVLAVTPAGSSVHTSGNPPSTFKVHDFIVTAKDGDKTVYYKLSVTTATSPGGRPVLAANPSLAPWRQGGSNSVSGPSLGEDAKQTNTLAKAVSARIDEWAEAYATGNNDLFRGITGGDPADYSSLGGFTVKDLQVVSSAPGPTDDSQLVRVRLVLTQDSAKKFEAASEFDLLITGASTQDPKIVAWGPPGTGPDLTDPNQTN
jgi:hypothetical protein